MFAIRILCCHSGRPHEKMEICTMGKAKLKNHSVSMAFEDYFLLSGPFYKIAVAEGIVLNSIIYFGSCKRGNFYVGLHNNDNKIDSIANLHTTSPGWAANKFDTNDSFAVLPPLSLIYMNFAQHARLAGNH